MKLKFAIALCLIVSLLCACGQPNSDIPIEDGVYSENESYKMYIEDGKWYIEFFEPSDAENNSSKEMSGYSEVSPPSPVFDSAADMKEMLTREELPDSLVQQLKATLVGRKRLELCDPNKICELTTPEDFAYDVVGIDVRAYSYRFHKQDSIGVIYSTNKEVYDEAFETEYLNFANENYTITSETTTEDRNARVVYSSTPATNQKHILYKITAGESEIYVVEQYVLRRLDDGGTGTRFSIVSDTIPKRIDIFANDGTNYWYGWFMGFEERPSVEWLSSFRLVPIE